MTDVARRAGVSTMTVSNVINGRVQRVSESTRLRVLAVISELGYQVNLTARNLRMGRTGAVGLAVPGFAPGYYAQLAERLADRFAAHGMRLAVERTGGNRVAELDALTAPRLSGYDGFVLSVVAGEVADLDRLSLDTPVVLIGEKAVPARFDHVLMDNVGGARMATELLIRTGSQRIVLLAGAGEQDETMPGLRTRGYRNAHAATGTTVRDELIVSCGFSVHHGYAAVRDLVGRGVPFDAVFALTDSAAIGALRALADTGRRVPEDVQVIGFDNLDDSRFTVPGLTTVEPGNDEMADAICALLMERIDAPSTGGAARVVMPEPRIVERESTRST
ncbi:LacI family DNA-binding transcriptional regulator [Pseudonocardia xinjiangensis]|uniref:LacI family transcriptional regulator n=1 Tax=Pseudonocardia xinjiangensis TaxID=75289 RepID=A0ABX1RFW9_9PSEU|nr:LacI family DNA-binding transcriptional regulator [Pseudonocardia xinjiangensis]NMH79288.1 LacI family transcriptional regulator [Pseudonocardia xinjiangensis]